MVFLQFDGLGALLLQRGFCVIELVGEHLDLEVFLFEGLLEAGDYFLTEGCQFGPCPLESLHLLICLDQLILPIYAYPSLVIGLAE